MQTHAPQITEINQQNDNSANHEQWSRLSRKPCSLTLPSNNLLEFVGEYVRNDGHSSFAVIETLVHCCDDELHDPNIVGEFRLLELEGVLDEAFCNVGELLDDEY